MVSSKRITPLTNSDIPGVVNNRSRYPLRLSSVEGTPTAFSRFSIVGALSSAARIPFPAATRDRATEPSPLIGMIHPRFSIFDSPRGTGVSPIVPEPAGGCRKRNPHGCLNPDYMHIHLLVYERVLAPNA